MHVSKKALSHSSSCGGMPLGVACFGIIAASVAAVLAGSSPVQADDNGIETPSHFFDETHYLKLSDKERSIYVEGAFDGFLFGYAARSTRTRRLTPALSSTVRP